MRACEASGTWQLGLFFPSLTSAYNRSTGATTITNPPKIGILVIQLGILRPTPMTTSIRTHSGQAATLLSITFNWSWPSCIDVLYTLIRQPRTPVHGLPRVRFYLRRNSLRPGYETSPAAAPTWIPRLHTEDTTPLSGIEVTFQYLPRAP